MPTRFVLRRDSDGAITAANPQASCKPAEADDSYASTIPLLDCGPDEPDGSTFTLAVSESYPGRTSSRGS